MQSSTVSQDDRERLQLFVSPEAAQRLRMVAGVENTSVGDIVSRLAEKYLPSAPKHIALAGVR